MAATLSVIELLNSLIILGFFLEENGGGLLEDVDFEVFDLVFVKLDLVF